MKTVAIVGVGLIGGSFALALKKAGFGGKVLGVSSSRTVKAALSVGAIDEALPLEEAVPQADFVYLAQPISRIIETIGQLNPLLRPGSLVTDAGSTKVKIVEAAEKFIRRGRFLGGHPLAGKEKRGVEEADADLFAGRTWVLTPSTPEEMETEAVTEFISWIGRIGAVPAVLSPAEHDRVVAYTSHLPQLASTALAGTVSTQIGTPEHFRVAGPGLADTTRLALSAYEIWRDILETNAPEVEAALTRYIERLTELRMHLTGEQMREEFADAARFAARLRQDIR